jgi:hypothetical protein
VGLEAAGVIAAGMVLRSTAAALDAGVARVVIEHANNLTPVKPSYAD